MQEYEYLLTLSFTLFDQTPNQGWRSLGSSNASLQKLQTMAMVLESYIDRNKQSLSQSEMEILHFHAGQVYALAEDNQEALNHFKQAYTNIHDVDLSQEEKAWILYVRATIAFLEKDLYTLKSCAEELKNNFSMILVSNIKIVQKMLKNHDQSYKYVYFSLGV